MTSIRLQDIERHSWRMVHRDGLLDILFGFMLLGACVSAKRVRRARFMRSVLAACAAVTMLLVVLTILSSRFGFSFLRDTDAVLSWGTISVLILVPIGIMAFFLDYPRLLLHASFFVIAEFFLIVLGLEQLTPFAVPMAFGIGGVLSFSIGVPIFVYFLRSVPRATVDPHGGLNE